MATYRATVTIPEDKLAEFTKMTTAIAVRVDGFKQVTNGAVTVSPPTPPAPVPVPAPTTSSLSSLPAPCPAQRSLFEEVMEYGATIPPITVPFRKRRGGYRFGIRKKKDAAGNNLVGKKLAYDIIHSEPRVWTAEEIGHKFEEHKFAAGSASSVLHDLVEEKKITRVARGRYCMNGLKIRL